jgi:hypothetical protein
VISVREATTAGDLVQITNELGLVFEIVDQQVDEATDDLSIELRITVPEDVPIGFHYFPIQLYSSNQSQLSIPAFISVTAGGGA